MSHDVAWATLIALGAYHGINPGMGWLFAVSRGMQQGDVRAVLRSLPPIAIGHELSLALVAVLLLGAASFVDPSALHVGAALALVAFGLFRFLKPRAHFRWTTMQVGGRELTLWSFLMSTAHGAGLMVAPVLLGTQDAASASATHGHAHDMADMGMGSGLGVWSTAAGLALHVAAMLLVMGVVSVVVYQRVGVDVLRRAWVNTDAIWAGAFVVAGLVTLFT